MIYCWKVHKILLCHSHRLITYVSKISYSGGANSNILSISFAVLFFEPSNSVGALASPASRYLRRLITMKLLGELKTYLMVKYLD